ncbi:hypothetical protein [Nannocystis radixulma]|uniref:Lipoprotein n=1 Tax=Nannocystis radixulma TaxID=2995305 RepID=A0ABT5BHX9_9BACT|nr:hypothetical protein [Nannocystis radixulma]MDC0672576.1 hypothetical protein [Nannocystis radixulma]
MHFRRLLLPCLFTFTLMPGCTPDSKNIGDTLDPGDESSDSVGDETDGHSSQSGDYPSTGDEGTTSTTSTAGESHSTASDDSNAESGFTTANTSNDSGDTFGTSDVTGDNEPFGFFVLRTWAGPCPPESDCDGQIMLSDSRSLRVEEFGAVGNPVIEAEVSEEDYLAAVAVFTDPELVEIIQGPPPMCNPPTDIYESMNLALDGQVFDKNTTGCSLPPVDAAREMAQSLRDKYLP